ncbi:MAG: hypothetical protein RLZZ511_1341 [Cyanobacteriota bacterium]|jgi:diguanylate cyclase
MGERVEMLILGNHQGKQSRSTHPIGRGSPLRSRRYADWVGADHGTPTGQAMKTILLLEPDRGARDLVLGVLAAAGWRAVVVADVAAMLRQARELLPEVMLLALPPAELAPVIAQIRQDPRFATVALIGLGPRMSRQDRRSWLSLGLDDCLSKPLIATAVEQAIAGCLQRQARMLQPYTQQVQRGKLVLERLAYWDEVTGLPNRRLFDQQVQQVLTHARQVQQSVAMFALNVDQLHGITVTFGQEMGAAVLQAVGQRLKQVEALAIARLGDTEFGLVFAEVWQHQQVAQLAQRLVDVVTEPYKLNGHEVRIQVSLGVASYPQHGNTGPQLLMQANTAMRWCQQQGQNGYRFYNPTMTTVEAERHLIAIDLGRAIARQELEVHYQPQIDVQTGQMIGMEALVRWRHGQRGMISPATFVPIAEELGLIVSIGEWVLRRACQEFMTMQQQLPHPVKLSVNLSMRQLHQGNFLETVTQILRETAMNPQQLQLELTETSLMQQVNTTIYTLQQLKQMGLGIAIDDFGTGYSSLTYLAKLPIDTLKIDHTFVSQLTLDQNAAVISNMIISMAHQLGLAIVAEGVETQGQLLFLHQLGCRSVQGYLYSPPLKAADVLRFAQTPIPSALILAPQRNARSQPA